MQIKKNGEKKKKLLGRRREHNFTQKKQKYCFFLFIAEILCYGYYKNTSKMVVWQVIKYNAYYASSMERPFRDCR